MGGIPPEKFAVSIAVSGKLPQEELRSRIPVTHQRDFSPRTLFYCFDLLKMYIKFQRLKVKNRCFLLSRYALSILILCQFMAKIIIK